MTEPRKWAKSHAQLEVYRKSFTVAMQIFELTRSFPREERYSLSDQIRRSSRSVCANITEAWRKRRYPAAFVCKLNDAEGEAAESQSWLQFAVECRYIDKTEARLLYKEYDQILAMLVTMIRNSHKWTLKPTT